MIAGRAGRLFLLGVCAILLAASICFLVAPRPPSAVPAATATSTGAPVVSKTIEWKGQRYDVVSADPSAVDLRIHLEGHAPNDAIVLTNAGIFESSSRPTGLLVEDGVERVPLNLDDGEGNFYLKPNGVFFVGRDGAHVVESREYPAFGKGVEQATQSGPLLVRKGVVSPEFSEISSSALERSGIGVTQKGRVVIAVSKGPVTFFDFAVLFRDELECPDALYLDGVISKLWTPSMGVEKPKRSDFAGIISISARR
jgi:uncharacterized protein YigE (DUF2233 family)